MQKPEIVKPGDDVREKRIPFASEAILIGSILLGVIVSLQSPVTVLSDSPAMSGLTNLMASFIPSIDRLAKVSNYPEVTRFTSAVLWASAPILSLLLFYPGISIPRRDLIRKKLVFSTVAWLSLPIFILMAAYIPEPTLEKLARRTLYHSTIRNVSESRMWLGVVGGAVSYTVAYCIYGFITLGRELGKIFFKQKN